MGFLLKLICIHLVYFISNAVKKRLVFDFSNFHGRCLFLLLNFAKDLDSRCLVFQASKLPFSKF